jgi:site-specific recombinase XerD
MKDVRQLPLFATMPASVKELSPHSRVQDVIPLFQQHLIGTGKSKYTVQSFSADMLLLLNYTSNDHAIGRYTTTQLNDYLHWLEYERGVPCSRKSYARRVTTLKVFFKWLYDYEVIPHDPARPLLQRSGAAPLTEILTYAEVDAAIAYARTMPFSAKRPGEVDTRPELVFRLILKTGMKKGEACEMQWEDIDRSNDGAPMLHIKSKSLRDQYKNRVLMLDDAWVQMLDVYRAQYKLTSATIFDCTPRNLEYLLADISKGAGLPHNISFEMLRWTCAVRDYRVGVEPNLIREKLGLSPISWYETNIKVQRLSARLDQDNLVAV